MAQDLHILNHGYHAQRIIDASAHIVVIGTQIDDPRVVLNVELFEQKNLLQKINSSPRETARKINFIAKKYDRIYIWGLQDIISYNILIDLFPNSEVRIVPDNIEFFLRFSPISEFSLRNIMKSTVFREFLSALAGKTQHTLGRMTFSLPKGAVIDDSLAFYNGRALSIGSTLDAGPYWTFVSQPYYADYQIDESEWAMRVVQLLRRFEMETGEVIRIRYHQRDRPTYKSLLAKAGFREATSISPKCVGFFSTFLFEAALSGLEVRLIFDDVRDLLGSEYIKFVDWFSDLVKIKTDPSEPLVVKPDSFRAILPPDVTILKGE